MPGGDLADEYVMVGAHYDHLGSRSNGAGHCFSDGAPGGEVCNGAADNASGVAAWFDGTRELEREYRAAVGEILVIMLDEVDKIGADWRGDPSSALLLDPAQNHSFRDHYLDVELDLSHVLFIATANLAGTIPGPLLDRMEVIRFDGYTALEKVALARGFLWPRQVERNGLRPDEVEIDDATLRLGIAEYTREAGVRQLERELGTLLRKIATGVASGATRAPVTVDTALVREAFGRPKFFQEAASRTAVPGTCPRARSRRTAPARASRW
jgi:ATP-dependent Lon protease